MWRRDPGGGGPAWGGPLAALAWRMYLYYGDRRVLEECYDPMRRYVDYLEGRCTNHILRLWRPMGFHRRLGGAGTRHGYEQLAARAGRRTV